MLFPKKAMFALSTKSLPVGWFTEIVFRIVAVAPASSSTPLRLEIRDDADGGHGIFFDDSPAADDGLV